MYGLIPAEKLAVVEKALLQTFSTTEVDEIILLAGGLSASKVYKIAVNDQEYVLKSDISAEPVNAYTCMEIAADAGIAPPVYYLNKAEGIAITGFIKNIPLQAVFRSPERLLSELAKTIKCIHGLPLFPKESSLIDTVDRLIDQFKASQMLTGPVFEECFANYDVNQKTLSME
ncbi:hypothetical protein [Pedobacter sp. NJ-S-72]